MKRRWQLGSLCLLGSLSACGAVAQNSEPGEESQVERINWGARSPWAEAGVRARPPGARVPPEEQQANPFKIFDNVYSVGIQTSASYLITTSEGLVLLDSTYSESADLVLDNVRTLGFDPSDIRYLFITHAHFDHAAGAGRVKQVTGARVGMSREDWEFFEQQQRRGQRGTQNPGLALARDLVITDGETIMVGDAAFTFYVTPGHTPGATSIQYQVRDGSRSYRALSPGGLGMNFGPEWTSVYINGIERLKQTGPWDVLLANHSWVMPPDLFEVERTLADRGEGPHPAVVGPTSINEWFDSVLEVAYEKLAYEQNETEPSASP